MFTRTVALITAAATALLIQPAQAAFVSFSGGIAAQSAWQAAAIAGGYDLKVENFEAPAIDTPVPGLPAMGLVFAPLAGGALPGIYQHTVDNTPFGDRQLANFPGNCCITGPFKFGDLVATVADAVDLYGLGFWNGDPQGDSVLRVYDRGGTLIGSVTASINTGNAAALSNSFAGFFSTSPIGRVEWEGSAGDGWNHYDGLQAALGREAAPVSGPATIALLGAGLASLSATGLGRTRRR